MIHVIKSITKRPTIERRLENFFTSIGSKKVNVTIFSYIDYLLDDVIFSIFSGLFP